ncbi:SEC-C metal-binding domain-containing protein [Deinococcus altitudinis]|uniref:SEC-C metal-binding domain-containing protein n=1 Tax=Deinococcus altitudinis TaxID=468914 RepID=UPI003891A566
MFFRRAPRLPRSTFSPADEAELTLLLASSCPVGGFVRFYGLATGLIATQNAPMSEVLTLLGVRDVPERLRTLVGAYLEDLKIRLDADLVDMPEDLYELEGTLEWLTGLGQAVTLDLDKARKLLTLPSPHVGKMMRRLLAFSPVGVSGAGLPGAAELEQVRQKETGELRSRGVGHTLHTVTETCSFLLGAYSDTVTGGGDRAHAPTAPSATVRRTEPRTGPNEPCPCGSGKKYKKCHGVPGRV